MKVLLGLLCCCLFVQTESVLGQFEIDGRRDFSLRPGSIGLSVSALSYPRCQITRTGGPHLPIRANPIPVHGYKLQYIRRFSEVQGLSVGFSLSSIPFHIAYEPGELRDDSSAVIVHSGQTIITTRSRLDRVGIHIGYVVSLRRFLGGVVFAGVGIGVDSRFSNGHFFLHVTDRTGSSRVDILELEANFNDPLIYGALFNVGYEKRIKRIHGLGFELAAFITGQDLYRAQYIMAPSAPQRNAGIVVQSANYVSASLVYKIHLD